MLTQHEVLEKIRSEHCDLASIRIEMRGLTERETAIKELIDQLKDELSANRLRQSELINDRLDTQVRLDQLDRRLISIKNSEAA